MFQWARKISLVLEISISGSRKRGKTTWKTTTNTAEKKKWKL